MRKTLLLVFIHGFKGGDDTFGRFPEHLRALISHALPSIDVVAIAYPKFETRGELKDCVERFREWLQNKVIDIEVAHSTPSPTVDPSVHTILIGHSMGGIVAAETVLLIANEQFLPSPKTTHPNFPSNTTLNSTTSTSHPTYHQNDGNNTTSSASSTDNVTPMFPRITGILAFDTPFLGISPGVIAHGAEGHYKTASTAYNAFTELSSAFGWGTASKSGSKSPKTPPKSSQPAGLLTNSATTTGDAAATPRWQSWGKYAMFAGAAGAVAAGGAAALYSQREKLGSGWGWVSGHLEFVGCLLRGEELKGRVERVGRLSRRKESINGTPKGTTGNGNGFVGSANFYTLLGRGANSNEPADSSAKLVLDSTMGQKRTFCKLPPSVVDQKSKSQKSIENGAETQQGQGVIKWIPATNDKSSDEITAHVSMFYPRDNPGFYNLGEQAKEIVVKWVMVDRDWYEASDGRSGGKGKTYGEVGDDGWEKPDYDGDEGVKEKVREKERGVGMGMTEPVWVNEEEADDVRMRDGSVDAEDLESSVVVDKAF